MWEQKKSKHPSVIVMMEYDDFASIEVEKTKKGNIFQYIVNIDVYNIYTDSAIFYDLKDIESALKVIKKQIEELYEDIPLFSDDDITNWIEDFQDIVSSF